MHVTCCPTDEHSRVNEVVEAIKEEAAIQCLRKEKVIWRGSMRWVDDDGVLSHCYDNMSAVSVCEMKGYDLVCDFNHVAIVRS